MVYDASPENVIQTGSNHRLTAEQRSHISQKHNGNGMINIVGHTGHQRILEKHLRETNGK